MVSRARGRRRELILGLREDADSPATTPHSSMSLASGKSGGGAGRGSGWPALGLRSNAG
jgi:hypothetical protein